MEGAFYLKILLGGFTRPPGDLPIDPLPVYSRQKKRSCNYSDLVQLQHVNT